MKPEIQQALTAPRVRAGQRRRAGGAQAAVEGGGNGNSDEAAARALAEARRVHRERGDFELVVRLVDLELGWETDKTRRAELYFEKGKVLADELLREAKRCAASSASLELRPDDEDAAGRARPHSLVRDNWQKIVKKYLDEAKSSTDRAAHDVALSLASPSSTPSISADGTRSRPTSQQGARGRAAQQEGGSTASSGCCSGEQRWDAFAALLERARGPPPTKEERVARLLLALAEVERARLGAEPGGGDDARRCWRRPGEPARDAARSSTIYTVEENWQALHPRLRERAQGARRAATPRWAGASCQIGMLWWKKLGNLERAERAVREARAQGRAGACRRCSTSIARYYGEERGREAAARCCRRRRRSSTDAKRRLVLGVEMARVAEASAGSVEKAIDLWKSVLKRRPRRTTDAVEALKRLYTSAPRSGTRCSSC